MAPFAEEGGNREEFEEFQKMWYDGVTERERDYSVSTKLAMPGFDRKTGGLSYDDRRIL